MNALDSSFRGKAGAWITPLVLMLLTTIAFYLRLHYAMNIHLYVDEFGTLLAIQSIVEKGVPVFPSGTFYSHGLPYSYLAAFLVWAWRFGETIARLPSVLLGALSIPLIYLVGRRLLSPAAGWLAAGALAVDPDAIIWGGRARMYVLLQVLVLAAVYLFVRGAVEEDRARLRILGAVCLMGALFTHPEAALLIPAMAAAMLIFRGLRRSLRIDLAAVLLVVGLGLAGVYAMYKWGQEGLVEAMSAERPFLAPTAAEAFGLQALASVFTDWHRLPWTVCSLGGLAFCLWKVIKGGPEASLGQAIKNQLTLYLFCGSVMLSLAFLVGGTWQAPRYAFMILPLLFLTAGQALDELGQFLGRRRYRMRWVPRWVFVALATVGLTAFTFVEGRDLAYARELGYDQVFRHVRDRWQEGDVILTVSPAASMVYLGRCDYFAIQRGYKEYLMPKEGAWVDRWSGAPPLNEKEQLLRVIRENPRTWFVVDGWRLETRYDVDFVAQVVELMRLDFTEEGVYAFLAEGYTELPKPQVSRDLNSSFGGEMLLLGYGLSSVRASAGDQLEVSLLWRAVAPRDKYTVFIHLVGQDGRGLVQEDSPILGGFYNPALWKPEERARDIRRLSIPSHAPDGLYRVEVGLYRPASLERLPIIGEGGVPSGDFLILDYIYIGEAEAKDQPHFFLGKRLGGMIELVGYDWDFGGRGVERTLSARAGKPLRLTLYWKALADPKLDYTVFLHLVDQDGRIVAQYDSQPLRGFAPTSTWRLGSLFSDQVEIPIGSSIAPGEYELYGGMYFLGTGERLKTKEGEDRIKLGMVRLTR